MPTNRKAPIVLGLLIASLGLAFGAMWALMSDSGTDMIAIAGPAMQASGDPDRITSVSGIAADPSFRSIYSEVIAEAVVESITPARFDTVAGTMPATPREDVEGDDEAWRLFQIATLDVVQLHAGITGTTKIVVPVMGGSYSDVDGNFVHEVRGIDETELAVGDTVMVFGYRTMHVRPIGAEPWQDRAFDVVDALANAGESSMYAKGSAYYIYDLIAGTATSPQADGVTLSISDLRDIVVP